MNKVLGIDLGTTYSCVACIDSSGRPVVLKNSEGELTTPSVVLFETDSSVVVGTSAKESAKLYPDQVVAFAKRFIGQPGANWKVLDIPRTPEEVSSYILRKLVNNAVAALQSENKLEPGETIRQVVITCPAYFGIGERESTQKAGELAGLEVLGIINEPTAAAISYGTMDAAAGKQGRVVLVYDLGGGTFDITMIDIQPQAIKVVCTGGDHSLGGKLWDDRVIEYLAEEFVRQTGNREDILSDPVTLQEISLSAERAKKMLSARDKAPVSVNYKGDRARIELTRAKFEELTADLLERTVLITREMLKEALKKGFTADRIDEILLVGGSTRMPQILQRLQQEFPVPIKIYDPDEAVAKGAAVYAVRRSFYNEVVQQTAHSTGKTERQVKAELDHGRTDVTELAKKAGIVPEDGAPAEKMEITNVTSRSFGTLAFETVDDGRQEVLYNMILKNTELPATMTRRFYTLSENQSQVVIRVLESLSGERLAAPAEGTEIGETIFELPEGLPAGSPIEIEFRLNEAGLLELHAMEPEQNREISARFETMDAISNADFYQAKKRIEDAMVL